MAVFIALLLGISGAAALIAIFGVKTANDSFGLLQERYERPGWSMLRFLARLRDGCLWDLWIRGGVVGGVS